MLSELGMPIDVDSIVEMKHIGRTSSQTRPLRLTLDCFHSRNSLLTKAKDLRKSRSFRNVFVNPDRTKAQRSEFKRLRDELKERRSKGENAVIYNRQVVVRDNAFGNFH